MRAPFYSVTSSGARPERRELDRATAGLAGSAELQAPHDGLLLALLVLGVGRVSELVVGLGVPVDDLELADDEDDVPEGGGAGRRTVQDPLGQADRHVDDEVDDPVRLGRELVVARGAVVVVRRRCVPAAAASSGLRGVFSTYDRNPKTELMLCPGTT